MRLSALHKTFNIAENFLENGGFARSFGLTAYVL